MKILHILDHSIPLHSGYTFRTRAILEQQRNMGWQTTHITSIKQGQCKKSEEEVDGLYFYRTKPKNSLFSKLPILNQLNVISSLDKRLDSVIEHEKPDILHAHSPCLNGVAALRAGKRHKLPVVYECRAFWEDAAADHSTSSEWGLRYRLTRAMETYVFKNADAVTTICEGLRKDIIQRGVCESKVTVIPNAVNPEQFSLGGDKKPELEERLGLSKSKILGFIGSFYAYEGLPLLLNAVEKLHSQHDDIKILLVGGGPQENALKEQVNKLGIKSKVIFTGRVPHAEVNDYYDLIDILVYPRISMRLTELVTPLKPLEAMAQGRLFVASDVGGHKELIQDGVNGRLFKAGNVDELERTISDLLTSPDEWQTLKTNGRKYVEEVRNWRESVSKYQSIYSSLAGNK